MRRTFLIRLFLLLLALFATMGAGMYVHLTRHVHERAEQLMSGRVNDLLELLVHEDECESSARKLYEETALHRAHAAAELLRLNTAPLQRQEELQELCNLMGAEQVVVTNAEGRIVAAAPSDLRGKDIDEDEQLRDFGACADDPAAEICRTVRPVQAEAATLQYAGVHRRDTAGTLLLGFSTHRLHRERSNEALKRLADHYNVGEQGHIIAFRGGAIINKSSLSCTTSDLLSVPLRTVSELTADGRDYFTYAAENREYRLVALMPAAEIYRNSMKTLRSLLLSNVIIFAVLYAAVALLLQRYVVRGLSRVINALHRITAGDLNERVEVNNTPEFRRLSADINAMVDTLRFYGEEEMADMNRELELARDIQSAALPNRFPAFPHRPEFDLYAACVPAMSVGGDFYDFFLQGEDRLCFLVADISETGVPAALYMMRCMSLIRSVARSGAKPETLARLVNNALCEGQSKNISLSLFYACLRISTGELRFINAGEPQAMLQHDGGTYEPLTMNSGMVMGLSEGATYRECRLTLQPGDRLLLWTRGVTEAENAEHMSFGLEGLRAALAQPAATVTDVIHQTRAAIRRFLNGTPIQSDVTLFALEYRSKKHAKGELSLTAGEQEKAAELFDEQMEAVFAAPADIADMKVTTAAILSALPPECRITMLLTCDESNADLTLRYAEPRYNPLISLPHLPIDQTDYTYQEEEGNTLTLHKNLS